VPHTSPEAVAAAAAAALAAHCLLLLEQLAVNRFSSKNPKPLLKKIHKNNEPVSVTSQYTLGAA